MRIFFLAVVVAIFLVACGKEHSNYSGKTGQERYCKENGWRYNASDNSCYR